MLKFNFFVRNLFINLCLKPNTKLNFYHQKRIYIKFYVRTKTISENNITYI